MCCGGMAIGPAIASDFQNAPHPFIAAAAFMSTNLRRDLRDLRPRDMIDILSCGRRDWLSTKPGASHEII
jgi:hypothetical protein